MIDNFFSALVQGGIGIGISKMLNFTLHLFYVMAKMLSGKLSCAQTGLVKQTNDPYCLF